MKKAPWRKIVLFLLAGISGISYCLFFNVLLQALKVRSGGAVDDALVAFFQDKQIAFIALEVVAAPLVEEFLFRKLLYGKLSGVIPKIFAALISAAVFGALHFSIPGAIYGFAFGLLLSELMETTGTWIGAVIAHGLANATSLMMNYAPELNAFVSARKPYFIAFSVILLGLCVFVSERMRQKEKE